jgi:large subunit ribosomal protein L13
MPQKTFRPDIKTIESQRRWHAFDAKDKAPGRLASQVADLLRGKHKPWFTPSIDCGDFVVVTNVKQMKWTGDKIEQKNYFSHSGYAGGAKVTPLKRQMERDPRKPFFLAVKRMLHANHLRSRLLKRLKIYTGDKHPYDGQVAGGKTS